MHLDVHFRRLLSHFSHVTRFVSFFFPITNGDARDHNVEISQVHASNRSTRLRVIKIFFKAIADHTAIACSIIISSRCRKADRKFPSISSILKYCRANMNFINFYWRIKKNKKEIGHRVTVTLQIT